MRMNKPRTYATTEIMQELVDLGPVALQVARYLRDNGPTKRHKIVRDCDNLNAWSLNRIITHMEGIGAVKPSSLDPNKYPAYTLDIEVEEQLTEHDRISAPGLRAERERVMQTRKDHK